MFILILSFLDVNTTEKGNYWITVWRPHANSLSLSLSLSLSHTHTRAHACTHSLPLAPTIFSSLISLFISLISFCYFFLALFLIEMRSLMMSAKMNIESSFILASSLLVAVSSLQSLHCIDGHCYVHCYIMAFIN